MKSRPNKFNRRIINAGLTISFLFLFAAVFFHPGFAKANVSSLTKTITPVSRNGSDFVNPYAIQNGDVLKITINYNVSNEATSIVDEYYKAISDNIGSYSARCNLLQVTSKPTYANYIDGGDRITFNINAQGNATSLSGTISYTCTVSATTAATTTYNSLPEPMVGYLHATQNNGGSVYYAGMSTSEIVLNHDQNLPLMGFVNSILADSSYCANYPPAFRPTSCYSLENQQSLRQMTSQTRTQESDSSGTYSPRYEMSVLLYPDNSIVGDAYLNGDLNNFAFYGRNLNKSSTSSLSGDYYTWGVKNYEFNKLAQSSSDTSSYIARVNQLLGEAPPVGSSALTSASGIYLQSKDVASINLSPTNADINSSPEGKVWKYAGNLTIPANKTIPYHGKGTLIVDGNLTISSGAKIIPPSGDESNNLMGIIVKGNVTLSGDNIVKAPIFATGVINVIGNNVFLYGSFIAKNFNVSSKSGIRFFYDYRLDSGWPPGFRYFNMPTANNTSS